MVRLFRSRFAQILCGILVFVAEIFTLHYSRALGFSWGATIVNMVVALFALIAICFLVPDTLMRAKWRYKSILVENERAVRGGVKGQHVSELRRLARESVLERYFVHYPWLIAEVTVVVIAFYAAWCIAGSPHGDIHGASSPWFSWLVYGLTAVRATGYWLFGLIPDWRFLFAGFLPLMLAPPIILELVWLERLYVLIEDTEDKTARLLLINGLFSGDSESLALESTVSVNLHRDSFFEWFIRRGTIVLKEKGAGAGDKIEKIYKPATFMNRIQRSINRLSKQH